MTASWWALALAIGLGTIGQLSLKHAMTCDERPIKFAASLLTAPMMCWLICYAATMVFWMLALRHIPLSKAFPILGLQYAMIPLLSSRLLHERLAPLQWSGVVLIVLGVALVGST